MVTLQVRRGAQGGHRDTGALGHVPSQVECRGSCGAWGTVGLCRCRRPHPPRSVPEPSLSRSLLRELQHRQHQTRALCLPGELFLLGSRCSGAAETHESTCWETFSGISYFCVLGFPCPRCRKSSHSARTSSSLALVCF